jgi:hypothetical protein
MRIRRGLNADCGPQRGDVPPGLSRQDAAKQPAAGHQAAEQAGRDGAQRQDVRLLRLQADWLNDSRRVTPATALG